MIAVLFLTLFPQFVFSTTCSHTRDVYVSLGYSADHVPTSPIQGQFNQLCPQTTETCCSSLMESTFENATVDVLQPLIPSFTPFNDRAFEIIMNAQSEFQAHMAHIRTFLSLGVITNNATSSPALQQVLNQLAAIVDTNANASTLATDINRLLLVLRLNLLNSGRATYSSSALECAVAATAGEKGFLNSRSVAERLTAIMSGRYHARELLANTYLSLSDVEGVGLPVHECIRSYSQLFYCHICGASTAGATPCRGSCDNVLAGCAGHMHILEPVLSSAQKSSSDLRVYETISSSWDLRQAVVDLRKLMLEAQSGTVSELQDLSNKVSGCGGLPSLSVPSVDEPLSSVAGHLSSVVPASFSTEFTKLFVDFKESLFDKFTDISNRFASLCNSAATSGFCWARTEVVLRTSTRKVSFGSDALYNNPDIIINGFDTDITSIRDDFSTHIASLQLQTNSTRSFLGTLTSTFTSSDPSSGWRCLPSAIVVVVCLFVLILSDIFVP